LEVTQWIRAAASLLVMFDYDGTLTPIVERPSDAHLPQDVRRSLLTLSECKGVSVAIVSGRELRDVQARVGLSGLIYAGNHGLQVSAPGFGFIEPLAISYRSELELLCDVLASNIATVEGAWVERKGLTASVHFRQAAFDRIEELEYIVTSSIDGYHHNFYITAGHAVYEIRPRARWHKGAAVNWIGAQLAPAADLGIYVGDDVTDEDAFQALRGGVTVRVGKSLDTAARYHLRDENEVPRWLEWLVSIRCSG
jgi:trehalose-phosphatase